MIDMLPPPNLAGTVRVPRLRGDDKPLPEFLPAVGRRRATVALFTGCIGDVMFRHVNWATARVLAQNGCDVVVPPAQVCCGAIHFHGGSSAPARELADRNLAAFPHQRFDAIVNNIAGCGSMLKDYGHHWHDARHSERAAWAGKVRDVNEFLDELGLTPPEGEIRTVATYHDACHLLHAQKIHDAPRRLLAQIPGLELRALPESELCCGAAGTYNLTEPEMSARLSRRKLENIQRTKARVAITANAGCALQIAREARQQGLQLAVVHPMEMLDWSYRNEKPNR
jgi:glycolate oxidase iron-sulfur subunit